MGKPIKIKATKEGYTISVEGRGLVHSKGGKLLDLGQGLPYVFANHGEAVTVAHQIGRYKLGLGDLIFTYIDSLFPLD